MGPPEGRPGEGASETDAPASNGGLWTGSHIHACAVLRRSVVDWLAVRTSDWKRNYLPDLLRHRDKELESQFDGEADAERSTVGWGQAREISLAFPRHVAEHAQYAEIPIMEQHADARTAARGGIVQRRWQDRPGKELEQGGVQPIRVLIRGRVTQPRLLSARCRKGEWGKDGE